MKKPQSKHGLRLALIISLILALLGALGTLQVSRAFEVDEDGTIEADQVINDDVFINAEQVVVDGTVNGTLIISCQDAEINGLVKGDLVIRGRNVTINGHVGNNLIISSFTLTLNGTVEGSVFAMSFATTLGPSSTVSRNLTFIGFSLEAEPGSKVERDVQAGGYQALMGGEVGRHLDAETSALEITGSVGGDVIAVVDAPDSPLQFPLPGVSRNIGAGLRVAEGAQIGGKLAYTSPVDQADAIQAAPGGGIEHLLPKQPATPAVSLGWLLQPIRELLTMLALGLLFAWRAPTLLNRLSDQAKARPIPAALWGLLVLIGVSSATVVAGVLLFVVWLVLAVTTLDALASVVFFIGGSAFALVLSLFVLIVRYGTSLVVAHLLGKLILRRLAPKLAENVIWPMVLGIVLYVPFESLLLYTPIGSVFCCCAGLVVWFVTILPGLGAFWLLLRLPRGGAVHQSSPLPPDGQSPGE